MSRLVFTDAIVLKSIAYKDRDKIYTLFTKDLGKISVLAKGIKKFSSKRLSLMDTQNSVKVGLAGSHELRVLTEVSLKSSFKNIKSDYEKLKVSYYLLEIISKYYEESPEVGEIFELLIKVLSRLDSLDKFDSRVENFFEMEFLRNSGYELNLKSCSQCSNSISDHSLFNLSHPHNGLICSTCLPQVKYLSGEDLSGLKLLQKMGSEKEVSFRELDEFLKLQVQNIISSNLKSFKYLS